MNRKGFTLIELLAVIVLIGILGVLIVPGLLDNVDTAKQTSYDTLIKNIVVASQTYFEECEYGDLSDKAKYNEYACEIHSNNTYIETTLGALANTGLLKVNKTKKLETGKEIKIVDNPTNNNDISNCKIKITKEVDTNYKVTYKVEDISGNNNCPNTYQ